MSLILKEYKCGGITQLSIDSNEVNLRHMYSVMCRRYIIISIICIILESQLHYSKDMPLDLSKVTEMLRVN